MWNRKLSIGVIFAEVCLFALRVDRNIPFVLAGGFFSAKNYGTFGRRCNPFEVSTVVEQVYIDGVAVK